MQRKRIVTVGVVCALMTLVIAYAMAQDDSQFKAYPCQHKSAEDLATVLWPHLPKSRNVQMVVDREKNRILISGGDNVQVIVRRVLSEADRPTPVVRDTSTNAPKAPRLQSTPKAPMTPRSTPDRPASGRNLASFVFVPKDRLAQLQRQLSAIFGNQLQVQRIGEREILLLKLSGQSPQRAEIEFDSVRSGVLIGGPTSSVKQLVALVQALVDGRRDKDSRTQVFRVHRKNHRSLRKLIKPPIPQPNAQGRARPEVGRSRRPRSAMSPRFPVTPAAYLYQAESPTQKKPVQGKPVPAGEKPPGAAEKPMPSLRQFEGVEIESLPDLDVIILRGRDQDLKQLAEIIEQLERISQETQPEVQIYPLRHVHSEAIAKIVTQTSADLIRGRAGRVTVTPLVKPNSLLLIGWGDAVDAVMQLIRKLDQPVSPQTQFAVFRLRYAAASAVQKTITAFLGNRNGLGPKTQTTIDARTNSLIVYAAPRDMEEVRRIVNDLDRSDSAAVNRARIFQIKNALAADVALTLQQAIKAAQGDADFSAILELQALDADGQRILRSGTLENVRITPNPRNNTIIVSSPKENMALIAELIRQLDSPADQAQLKVFRITNGNAESLVLTLRSLLPSSAGGPRLSSAPGETSFAPLRFSVDSRSNSIIATGSEGDLRIVEALLVKLDQSNAMQRKTTVYQLKNSPAVDVASAVNQYLSSRRQLEQAAPGTNSPFQDLESEVIVVPEPVANKLVLAATPRYFEEISKLIEKLDEQPPQVMIQVLIAEVALGDTDEFGVELGLQDSVLFDRSLLGDILTTTSTSQTSTAAGIVSVTEELIRSATNLPGFAFNNGQPLGNSGSSQALTSATRFGGQSISNFAVGRSNDQLGFGGLVLSASSNNVSILLRALQESRRVRVLSRPQIRTLDNQPAFIQVGQRVPRIIGSTVNQNGQSNSVALENVGLILGVTPRISSEGNVVMEIDAEKSSLGPEQDGIPVAVSVDGTVIRSPRVDTTTAQATVSAADGETIVLGGLITESKQEFHRQVPWLGDLPILGNLFRYDGVSSRRTELLIILTPRVIRTKADSDQMRQAEMARMSWCAADVFKLQGDVGFIANSPSDQTELGDPEVIFPDENPAGQPARPKDKPAPAHPKK